MNKQIRSAAVSTSVLIFLLMCLLFVMWIPTLDPCSIRYSRTLVAEYVPMAEDTQQDQIANVIPETAFQTSYAAAVRNNTVARIRQNATEQSELDGYEPKVNDSFCLAETDSASMPVEYTKIQYPYLDFPIYMFIDDTGSAQYRVYAERTKDSVTQTGYLKAIQVIKDMKIGVEYDPEAEFVDIKDEAFGTITLEEAPAEKTGNLIKEYGMTGTYYLINSQGQKEYYVYGHYVNGDNAFFIADSHGVMVPGTLPIDSLNGGN